MPASQAITGPPENVTRLTVQTRWFPLYREGADGEVAQRVVASEKDTDTLAREILASGQIREVPDVSGPMPDLGAFPRLRALTVENRITTPLPATLGETHRQLEELRLAEWEGEHARVPASLRGGRLRVLTLPAEGALDCGLDLPELRELKLPIGLLERWRGEIPKLVALEQLEITPDASGVRALPDELASLPRLRELHASHLGLTSLPPLPASLSLLAVSDNQLVSLAPRLAGRELVLYATANPIAEVEARWLAEEMAKPPAVRRPFPGVLDPVTVRSQHPRFFVPSWEGIGTIAVAGELVLVGRRGGFDAAAFHLATGELAWEVSLDLPAEPRAITSVGHGGGHVIVQGRDRVRFIDPGTGAVVREAAVVELSHASVVGDVLFGIGPDPVYWGRGGGMAYRLPELAPIVGLENVGAVSADGRLVTLLGDAHPGPAIRIVEIATGAVLGTIAESARHAFRGNGSLFVVDGENVAHEHALTGARLRSFPLGADMKALPENRRAGVTVPYVDPLGELLVVSRNARRRSAVDNTIAIFDAVSGALLKTTPPHAPLRGNLDPRYYGGSAYAPLPHPPVLRHGSELFVGALVRTTDEPAVGAGLTVVPLSLPRHETIHGVTA